MPTVRSFLALALLLPCAIDGLAAQVAPASPAVSHPSARCLVANSAIRTTGGALVGAWLGFVAVKIKLSDWSDASQTQSAHRMKNQATVGGALVGAALANLMFRSHGCGAASRTGTGTTPLESPGRRPITADEIQRSGINGNVYDLVYTLRRNWLNTRGVETLSEAPREVNLEDGRTVLVPGEPKLVIYLDNVRLGTISALRDVPIAGVQAVRFFNGPQATYRWGAGHSHGAIEVLTVLDTDH